MLATLAILLATVDTCPSVVLVAVVATLAAVACGSALLILSVGAMSVATPVACPVPMPADDGVSVAMRVASVLARLERVQADERAAAEAARVRAAVAVRTVARTLHHYHTTHVRVRSHSA